MRSSEESGRRSLTEHLGERIGRSGRLTFHDWMEAALYDPFEGYYRRVDLQRWGREGDYRTSPERSPLFAATFARYFARLYESLRAPAQWTIVEVGAGAGHFAEAALATLRSRFPQVFAATTYVIDEVSDASSAALKTRLAGFSKRVEFQSLNSIARIDAGLIFSNELLDAFPVHRVTVQDGQLNEFYVSLGDSGEFKWSLGPLSTMRIAEYLTSAGAKLAEGQIVEINLRIEDYLTNAAARLGHGYVVTVDYGAEGSELYGTSGRAAGTLRGFRRHAFTDDLLARPGQQDLTATIDWSFVKRLGERLGLETIEFERQDRFLLKAGLLEEMEAAVAELNTDGERLQLRTNSREMILPNGLAASFQVLVQRKLPQG